MTVSDLTTEILIQIRDGVHQTRTELGARLDGVSARLDQTNAKLDRTNARLDRTRTELIAKIDETNSRLGDTNAKLDRTRIEVIAKLDDTNAKLGQTNTRLARLEDGVSTLIGQVTVLADRDRGLTDTVADLQRRVEALEQSARG